MKVSGFHLRMKFVILIIVVFLTFVGFLQSTCTKAHADEYCSECADPECLPDPAHPSVPYFEVLIASFEFPCTLNYGGWCGAACYARCGHNGSCQCQDGHWEDYTGIYVYGGACGNGMDSDCGRWSSGGHSRGCISYSCPSGDYVKDCDSCSCVCQKDVATCLPGQKVDISSCSCVYSCNPQACGPNFSYDQSVCACKCDHTSQAYIDFQNNGCAENMEWNDVWCSCKCPYVTSNDAILKSLGGMVRDISYSTYGSVKGSYVLQSLSTGSAITGWAWEMFDFVPSGSSECCDDSACNTMHACTCGEASPIDIPYYPSCWLSIGTGLSPSVEGDMRNGSKYLIVVKEWRDRPRALNDCSPADTSFLVVPSVVSLSGKGVHYRVNEVVQKGSQRIGRGGYEKPLP